jgi:hypothetical protein
MADVAVEDVVMYLRKQVVVEPDHGGSLESCGKMTKVLAREDKTGLSVRSTLGEQRPLSTFIQYGEAQYLDTVWLLSYN